MPIRKDDEVLIVRGKYKGKEGKVTQVSSKASCVVSPFSQSLRNSGLPKEVGHPR